MTSTNLGFLQSQVDDSLEGGEQIVGIGIDLVSWDRIKRFLADHPFESLSRLLTSSEQEIFRKVSCPTEFFARLFAAKEAFFKARNGGWMGESVFRQIEVVMEEKRRFRIRCDVRTEGRFFETPDGIGAQVILSRKGKVPC